MKTVKNISSLILALTFLVSSLGFTANRMVCLKSGKVKLSLTKMKDCCPEGDSDIPVVKSNCCDITNTSFDLGDFQNSQKQEVNASVSLLFFAEASRYNFTGNYSSQQKLIISYSDLPPPMYGRLLLNFISTLLI
jgi:hypothetical protein